MILYENSSEFLVFINDHPYQHREGFQVYREAGVSGDREMLLSNDRFVVLVASSTFDIFSVKMFIQFEQFSCAYYISSCVCFCKNTLMIISVLEAGSARFYSTLSNDRRFVL